MPGERLRFCISGTLIFTPLLMTTSPGRWSAAHYEPKTHKLLPHSAEYLRKQTGLQDFVATAPLNLVCVAHGERMTDVSPEERRLYAYASGDGPWSRRFGRIADCAQAALARL
ncbi:MAG TPA: hypothetical protein VKS24_15970 [Bradyrhizobium sp.]|nr:hypothetical protein [Bradyrhizobium sp.]